MKYSEYNSKHRAHSRTAFYTVIACCLLALGGASWFAASSIGKRTEKNGDGNSEYSESVEPPVNSADDGLLISKPSDQTAKPVSDEPFSSEKAEEKTDEAPAAYGSPLQGEVLKKYSENELQYSATLGDMRLHSGVDIACEEGTAVSSAGSGRVMTVEEDALWGTVVSIDHGNGIVTKYASLTEVNVKVGDTVVSGDIIGFVGDVPCECADQSHLHFEVLKNGHGADPFKTLGID